MIQTSRTLIESADGVYAKLTQTHRAHLHAEAKARPVTQAKTDHNNTDAQEGGGREGEETTGS